MRLVRVRTPDGVRVGLVDGAQIRRGRNGSMTQFVEAVAEADAVLEDCFTSDTIPYAGAQLAAPTSDPRKIVAIGQNYLDHIKEQESQIPSEPIVFAKFSSALSGPGDPIRWSRALTDSVDYEAELAVVIGRRARAVSEDDALLHVFGYTCLNDVSARDLQFRDGQWVRGKSLDTFCPIGPCIVTADEIGDPQSLRVRCEVGAETLQDASTSDMIFSVRKLISFLSNAFTLEPGDLLATGTPPGVGWFRTPPRVLQNGDRVTVTIERIGALSNVVVIDP
jgi:2-keto-4-pentenoate hydratase/2-oxohepta-3-ene-1,7-dioic acid hydratase in catechol pathway